MADIVVSHVNHSLFLRSCRALEFLGGVFYTGLHPVLILTAFQA